MKDEDKVPTLPALKPRIAVVGSAEEHAVWRERLAVATSMAQWRETLAEHVVALRTGRLQALFVPSDEVAVRGLRLLSQAVPVVVASSHLWSILGDARYASAALVREGDDLGAALSLAFHRHACLSRNG